MISSGINPTFEKNHSNKDTTLQISVKMEEL